MSLPSNAVRAGLYALVMCVVVPTPVAAQVSTGGVRGVVRDQSGGVLPRVTVRVAGPALMGQGATGVTDMAGVYRFSSLPVGLYSLTFSLAGFSTTQWTDARVEVGRTIEHDVVLQVGPVTEDVVVVSRTPVVDAVHSGSSTVFNQQLIENVPTTRFSFFDSITFAPAVKTDQTPNVAVFNIFGSNADQNSFQYDGVDISSPSFGSPWDFPSFEMMREIEVRAVGASAEQHGFQGGVVNIVTKSGSNSWKGVAGYFATSRRLVGNNTPDEAFPFTIDYGRNTSMQVGGPIVRDRVWVFGLVHGDRSRQSDVGVDPAFAQVRWKVTPFGKVDAALTTRDRIGLMVSDNNFWAPFAASRTSPPETVLVEHGHNPIVAGRWVHQLDQASLIEVKGGGIYIRDRLDPYSGDLVTPGRYDYADGRSHDSAGYTWLERENKTTLDVSYTRSVSRGRGGSHDLKAGLQHGFASAITNDAYLQDAFYYDFAGPYLVERHEPSGSGGRVTSLGLFVQDDWAAAPRLTLNLGVRFDRTTASIPAIEQYDDTSRHLTGRTFPAVDDLASFAEVSPRLGVVFRLTSSAQTVVRAGYGRHYGKFNTNLFSVVSPGNTSFDGFEYNPATRQYDLPSYHVASGEDTRVDPDLRNQFTDQISIGLERQLHSDFGIDVSYVYKRDRDLIRQRDTTGVYVQRPLTDEFQGATKTLTVYDRATTSVSTYTLTNRTDLAQSYHAVVAQAYKRWSKGWQLHASYVWQRARGYASGDIGIHAQDPSAFSAASRNYGRDPNDLINAYGSLPTDSTHAVKLQAAWQASRGVQVAARYSLESGRPYGRVVNALDLGQGVRPVLAEPRGAYHLPAVSDLQFRVTYDVPLGGDRRVRLSADVFNLLNADTALTVRNNSSEAGADFGQKLSVFAPRRAILGVRFEF